jgi:phage terminase large subunit-like protein
VLEDLTCRGGPEVWSRVAVVAFDKWDADAVVIERNQGGDMCRHTLRTVRPTLPVVEVVASRGKHVRAEPIAALYALGKISHVGTFPELEQQMCLMTAGGFAGEGSPDRVDALVWGMSQLFSVMTRSTQPVIIPPFVPKPIAPRPGAWLRR